MLQIDARESDGVVVLDLTGRLDLEPQFRLLAQHVQKAAQRPEPRVLINLEGLVFINSMGLDELVTSFATVRNQGGYLVLAAPCELVADVLKVARLPDLD